MQNFEDVMERDCYYVDKTPFIEKIEESNMYFFFIRPPIDHVFNNRMAILSDNVNGLQALVRCAYANGHRRIAFIHGERTLSLIHISTASISTMAALSGTPAGSPPRRRWITTPAATAWATPFFSPSKME